jgi:hypothetical protein
MRVLVACEVSGVVRNAFRKYGHDAYSCDLAPNYDYYHIQMDVLQLLSEIESGDRMAPELMIAHPPCQHLSVSGIHWNDRNHPKRSWALTDQAAEFFMALANAPIERIAIENPTCIMSTRWRKYDQKIQPYEFGENASKGTCLWLKNLPPLVPTERVLGRMVQWKGRMVERWANQTDSGQNRLGPCETRSADRARTYQGIANAMAEQWGG